MVSFMVPTCCICCAADQSAPTLGSMRLVRCSLVVGVSLVGSLISTAHADGDALGPREVAVGEALRANATGASAIGMNPAGLPLNRELVFEGGYGYRLSDD